MKVKKLIKMLKKLDQEAVILVDQDLYANYDKAFFECRFVRSVNIEKEAEEYCGGHRCYKNTGLSDAGEVGGVVIE